MKIEHQESNDRELLKKLKEKTLFFFFYCECRKHWQNPPPPKKTAELEKNFAFLICLNYIHDTDLYCSHLYVQIYWSMDLLGELDTGSGPDFEAKKHAGQTMAIEMTSSHASIGPKHLFFHGLIVKEMSITQQVNRLFLIFIFYLW